MTRRRVRTIFKLLPLTAVAASAHIALAAMPDQVVPDPSPAPADASPSPVTIPAFANHGDDASPVARPAADRADPRQVECMAKVIVHEAGNQPRRGQIAVAQVIHTRMKDGRFGRDACSVVKQRGQFFDVDAYDPSRDDDRWATAVAIADDMLRGEGEDVVPGALFFHSAGASMRGRVRLTQIADHTFYR